MHQTDLVYNVNDKPPLLSCLLLGLQHVTLMSVYLAIVVIIVRSSNLTNEIQLEAVRMGMIVLAIATIIQALRPPFGSGYLAAPVVSAIYLKELYHMPLETMHILKIATVDFPMQHKHQNTNRD